MGEFIDIPGIEIHPSLPRRILGLLFDDGKKEKNQAIIFHTTAKN